MSLVLKEAYEAKPQQNGFEQSRGQYIDKFTSHYRDLIGQPCTFLGPEGICEYPADDINVNLRSEHLAEYLRYPPETRDSWGRTVFSEPVSADILRALFASQWEARGLSLSLAPASLDASISDLKRYQKGADFVLSRSVECDGAIIEEPVCGIDVTLAKTPSPRVERRESTRLHKRERPGFQSTVAMPVIIVSTKGLRYEGDRDFYNYLDREARNAVLRGEKEGFHRGLSKEDFQAWGKMIGDKFARGIQWCKESMGQTDLIDVADYPHIGQVYDKLGFVEEMVADYQNRWQ